jgi:tetratricopeptide (TPR) repeat protein
MESSSALNSIVLPIIATVIGGIILLLIEKKISLQRAVNSIIGSILVSMLIIFVLHNVVGIILLNRARSVTSTNGCLSSAPLYERVVIWDSRLADARREYVICNEIIGRSNSSVRLLESLEKDLDYDSEYWQDRALAYYYVADIQKMIISLNSAVRVGITNNNELINFIGQELHGKFFFAESEEVLRIARINDESDINTIFWLAWSLYEQQKFNDAYAHFEKCIIIAGDYQLSRCYAGQGFILQKQGLFNEARAVLQQSISINPDQEDVLQVLSQLP